MKRRIFNFLTVPILFTAALFTCTSTRSGETDGGTAIYLDQWKYIEVDSQRAKHGDWAEPAWLKYFGLDMMDVTGDNFKDIVAIRSIKPLVPGKTVSGIPLVNTL